MASYLLIVAAISAAAACLVVVVFPFAVAGLDNVLKSAWLSFAVLVVSLPALVYWLVCGHRFNDWPTAFAVICTLLSFLTGFGIVGLAFALFGVGRPASSGLSIQPDSSIGELRASLLHLRVLLAFFGLLTCAVGVASVGEGDIGVVVVYPLIAVLCAWGYCYFSDIRFDNEKVSRRHPWGTFSVRWDEITEVAMAADGGCIVFFAGGKRLPILGPAFWRSTSGREIGSFIDSRLDERAIVPDSKDKLRCGRAIDARERN